MVAIALAVSLVLTGASVEADEGTETFKSAQFLTWKRSSQEFYIDTSIGMATLIINQNDKSKGTCISDWYAADQQAAYDYILTTMQRFPEYHPRGTLAAILEKKCGSMTFK